MIRIGEWNDLTVRRTKDFGIYLGCNDDDRDVLLPKKYVHRTMKVGDVLHVFIYRDSDDRIIATTNVPYITMNKLAVLKCVGTTKIGAFMDWGLEKDILLPFKEQTGAVREGGEYLVKMYSDRSDRLCVTMKVYDDLRSDSPYKQGDEISGIVIEYNEDMGAFVAVDNKFFALIPKKEIHSPIYPGNRINGRVSEVREDGKLNLTLQKPIKLQIKENTEMILRVLESYDGVLPFTDKADAAVIEKEFGISKRAFKTSVGKLLKDGLIKITEKNIILLTEEEKALRRNNELDRKDIVSRPKKTDKPLKSAAKPTSDSVKKGTVKFNRSQGGRRNNRRAMLAELEEHTDNE